ncbi:hypothetical protein BJ875DRAFT_238607 [Amylocarpus encephaloides]|uniref:Chitin synthase activator n=1 Tax=Amylocarpus encephaloides TaxID=45428 RepID=A0A9P7Y7F7_9HELO|nr:hypothetical protein BJ875DRAFT_238607 [Amylocarpus encephaloides]
MAYDANSYQPPQRPYNGRADRRPGPPGPQQSYSEAPQPQQYSQEQYPPQQQDQYAQDGYGYDNYNNQGYDPSFDQGYDGGYQNQGGGRGRGNGYPPSQNPPRQGYPMNDERGGMAPRGGGRGPPMQRPPPDARGGYGGQGRGYPNGAPMGRGGRPPGPAAASSDPGPNGMTRKPLKSPPMSPDVPAWDNPYGGFGGGKQKSALVQEQEILQNMAAMEVGEPNPNKGRSRGPGSKGSQGYGGRGLATDDYGRPSLDGQRRPPPEDYGRRSADSSRRPPDNYGRPSMDGQRNMPPRGFPNQGPPQPGYPDPRRGPSGGQPGGYQSRPQNGYSEQGYDDRRAYGPKPAMAPPAGENFGAPGRSMTMPNNQQPPQMGRGPHKPMSMEGPGSSAPYHGPIGRGMPPRPATAGGQRPPQRNYLPQDPYGGGRGQQPAIDTYQPGYQSGPQDYSAAPSSGVIDEVYDAYYEPRTSASPARNASHASRASAESEMPNFEAVPNRPGNHRRGASIDEHIQNPAVPQDGYPQQSQQLKPVKSQPDFRGRAQPQAAVFEMAGAPPMPNAYPQQGYDDGYGQQNGQYDQALEPVYPQYNEPPPQNPNSFVPPPRGASAAAGRPGPGQAGYAGGLPTGPRGGGLPKGPSPQNGLPRSNTAGPDSLPSHPPPVRAGLIPNSMANLASNKPTPVRNYNNISPTPQLAPPQLTMASQQQAPQQQSMPLPQAAPTAAAPVTTAELENLRQMVKANPGDQSSAFTLAKKLVEASEVIVQAIPDQRARTKQREKYVMDAHKILKKLVQQQHTDSMFFLADCHGKGMLGLEHDHKEAFTLYQSAAKAGHAAAAYRTAVCCELGNDEGGGTRKDPLKAIQWYKRAAMLGDTPAMYKMGMILLKGLLGQPKNPREAVGWLKRAAERADAENPHALHELGLLFQQPQSAESSVVRDEEYSFSLFQQAADLGYKFSQYRLGCAYEYGLFNCTIDPRSSIMWYSRAAAQGEHQSELALSGWYLTGSDNILQQNDTEAYLWAKKAAMAGLAKAEYAMGYFTEVGIGSPANLEDAKRWYWRAAAQNSPKARERLEDLKRGGSKAAMKSRDRISRSKVGKQQEGECTVM